MFGGFRVRVVGVFEGGGWRFKEVGEEYLGG